MPRTASKRNISALGKGSRDKVIAYLMQRDGNRCQIPECGFSNRRIGTGNRGPSVDHIVPISKGGDNVLENIQLAHLRCNVIKSNRATGDQLALIG